MLWRNATNEIGFIATETFYGQRFYIQYAYYKVAQNGKNNTKHTYIQNIK